MIKKESHPAPSFPPRRPRSAFRRALPGLALALLCGLGLNHAAQAQGSVENLLQPKDAWTFLPAESEVQPEAFAWSDTGHLAFETYGTDVAQREIEALTPPFEWATEIEFERGKTDNWRNNGLVFVLSSAPVDAMEAGDWAINGAVLQQGFQLSLSKGGAGRGIPRNEKAWKYDGQGIPVEPALVERNGGHNYSARLPSFVPEGMRARLHWSVGSGGELHITLSTNLGAEGPYWEIETTAQEPLPEKPLRYATVFVQQEPRRYAEGALDAPYQTGAAYGTGLFAGEVTHLEIARGARAGTAALDTFIRLEATGIPGRPRPEGSPSVLLGPNGIEDFRQRMELPYLAEHRKLVYQQAAADDPYALALAYLIDGDESHLEPVFAYIDKNTAVNDEDLIGWQPGITRQKLDINTFASHRVGTMATLYDLLYDELDDERRRNMQRLMARYLRHYRGMIERGDWWFKNNPSNTVGVGGGIAGQAALTIAHEYPELSAEITELAAKTIREEFAAAQPDGGQIEGSLYYNYGLTYPILFLQCLINTDGDDRGLIHALGLRNIDHYYATALGGDGKLVPFNDSMPWLTGYGPSAYAGSAFNQPLLRWLNDHMADTFNDEDRVIVKEQNRGTFLLTGTINRDAKPSPEAFPGLPVLAIMDSTHEAMMRDTGADFIPGMATAVKGKNELETHHRQQDHGSFVLYAGGEMLLLDPGYFNGGLDEHSGLTFGTGDGLAKTDRDAISPIRHPWESEFQRSVTVDAAAFHFGARKANRVFVQVADEALVILDDLEPLRRGETVGTLFQAASEEVTVDGQSARVHGTERDLLLHFFGPTVDTLDPLEVSHEDREFSKKAWVYHRLGTEWSAVRASYMHFREQPTVSVLQPVLPDAPDAAPQLERMDGHIRVTLPSGREVNFREEAGDWRAVPPLDL